MEILKVYLLLVVNTFVISSLVIQVKIAECDLNQFGVPTLSNFRTNALIILSETYLCICTYLYVAIY